MLSFVACSINNLFYSVKKINKCLGFEAGTFLQRTKPRKSGTGVAPRYEHGEENEYYQPEDLYVGNILYLNGYKFLLTAADALTHDYMEKNSHLVLNFQLFCSKTVLFHSLISVCILPMTVSAVQLVYNPEQSTWSVWGNTSFWFAPYIFRERQLFERSDWRGGIQGPGSPTDQMRFEWTWGYKIVKSF